MALPINEETKQVFGTRAIGNHLIDKELGEYVRTTFEAHYDVLNNIAIKAVLSEPGNRSEVDLAIEALDSFGDSDLLIYDRAYAGYPFIARLAKEKKKYLIRCSKGSFAVAQAMFRDSSSMDIITTINVTSRYAKQLKEQGLPASVTVRLVKVILSTGEPEVLVTSLLDEEEFPVKIFAELHHLRWGVETYFSKLKGRLGLENFTGKSVEAVKQDFWSTIMISNLETIMTGDLEEEINSKIGEAMQNRAINKAVSFNAIKNLAFEILSAKVDQDILEGKLKKLCIKR